MVPERRKQVRIQLRRDLAVVEQSYEGRPHYVLKDPVSLQYFRFRAREYFLLQRLDGTHTLEEIQREFEQQFRPHRLPLETVENFAHQLVSAGLAHGGSADTATTLLDRKRRQQRMRWLAAATNLLAIRVPLFDPDRLLARLLPCFRWVYSLGAFALSIGLILTALLLVATHFDAFRSRLPAAHEFFSFRQVIYLWIALGAVKIIHEFGHGLSCKAFGGEVHEMGALFLCLSPCLYCNVSDAWTMPSKWRRIIISFAGIYVELVIAALATFLWWNSASHPFINNLSLSLMVVCSLSTVVFNGNPLMRYDGYYILADWLEIPNLGERAGRLMQRLFLEHGLGMEVRREPTMAPWRQVVLAAYAATSFAYRWLVTVSVLWLLHRFLKAYRLEMIGTLLAGLSILWLIGWPLGRTIYNLAQNRRWPNMSGPRVLFGSGLAVAVLGLFLCLPLPIAHIRQVGVVQVRPDATDAVFVPTSALLERLAVRDGQRVSAGDLLAEFRSLDLEDRLADVRMQQDIRDVQLRALRQRSDQARVGGDLARLAGEQARSAQQLELCERTYRELRVCAPRAGVVMGLPRVDAIGQTWEHETRRPLCSVGEPGRLWVLVPLTPSEYRLLKMDLEEARRKGTELPVKLRIQGRGAATWSGHVVQLPEAEAVDVPLPLTQQAGGPVAVRPTRDGSLVPINQQYLVAVELQSPDAAIYPGSMAQVVIGCRKRTAAWWLWRAVVGTLELAN